MPFVQQDAADEDLSPRLRSDAVILAEYAETLRADPTSSAMLEALQSCAHKLAGAAGVYGFLAVSHAASALEDGIIDGRAGCGTSEVTAANLGALLDCLDAAIAAHPS